jgi:hypothetical protein
VGACDLRTYSIRWDDDDDDDDEDDDDDDDDECVQMYI